MNHGNTRYRGSSAGILACLCLSSISMACDFNPLEQESPSRIEASTLEDPANANLLVRSAISQFGCALALHVYATGLVSDELADGSVREVLWDYDRRTLSASRGQYATGTCDTGATGAPGNYMALSAARFEADNALRLLDQWTDAEVPNRSDLIAQSAAYAGYSLVLLGESMCSAAIGVGSELSRDQLFEEATGRFDRALQSAGSNETILNLATLGRARALLNLGSLEEAGADAERIPQGFVVNATYSDVSDRRRNRVYTAVFRNSIATVGPAYRNLGDPRVRVQDAGKSAADSEVPLFLPMKYDEVTDPIPVATWEEARLILAQARLASGDTQGAVDIINGLHTRAPEGGLPPYAGGTATEVEEQIIEERRRELFLEGQRLGDLIRYGIMPDPQPGTPFYRGGVYGDQLCFPLPVQETSNNPNF